MPLPLILAALGAAGTAAGGAGLGGALTGLGASGMAGAGPLASLAGPQSFLSGFGAPAFGASGFMSQGSPGLLASLMGQGGGENRNTMIQGIARDLGRMGGGAMPFNRVRARQQQGSLMNQGSRRG